MVCTHTHTHTHTNSLSLSLNELSARRRGEYLSNKHKRQIPMPSARFEHAIPTIKRLQSYALDRTANGIGKNKYGIFC